MQQRNRNDQQQNPDQNQRTPPTQQVEQQENANERPHFYLDRTDMLLNFGKTGASSMILFLGSVAVLTNARTPLTLPLLLQATLAAIRLLYNRSNNFGTHTEIPPDQRQVQTNNPALLYNSRADLNKQHNKLMLELLFASVAVCSVIQESVKRFVGMKEGYDFKDLASVLILFAVAEKIGSAIINNFDAKKENRRDLQPPRQGRPQ